MLTHGHGFVDDAAGRVDSLGVTPFYSVNSRGLNSQGMDDKGVNPGLNPQKRSSAIPGRTKRNEGWNLLDFDGERDSETTNSFNEGCRQIIASSRSRVEDYSRLNKVENRRSSRRTNVNAITDSSTWIDLCESEDTTMVFEGEINEKKDLRAVFQQIYDHGCSGLSVLLIDSPEPNAYTGIFVIKDGAYICNAAIEDEYLTDYQALKKLVAVENADYEYFTFVSNEFEIPVPLLKIRLNFLSFVRPDIPDFVSDMIESLELEEVLFAERPEELDLRAITGSHQLSEQKIEKLAQWKPVPIKNRSKSTSSLPRYARGLTMGISSPEESDYANTAKAVKGTFNKRRYHFKAICLMLLLSTAAYHAWSHVVHQPQVVTLMKQISTVIHTVI